MRTVGWKMLAEAPGLLASLVIWSMVYALLPGWARSVALVAAALLAAASQSRVGERLLTGLAVGARRPSRAEQATLADGITKLCEQRMGPPAIDVRVVRHPGWGVGAFGRRTLLVSREMIIAVRRGTLNQEEVDALLVAGVGMLRSGIVCWDGLIAAATLPWLPVRTVFAGVVQVMAWLPLVGFAWRVRAVVIGIAIWQQGAEGQVGLAVSLAVLCAISYLAPVAARKLSRTLLLVGDQFALRAGHSPGLARFLRRFLGSDLAVERLHLLAPPAPHLSVVR